MYIQERDRVKHQVFGEGIVKSIEIHGNEKVASVKFDNMEEEAEIEAKNLNLLEFDFKEKITKKIVVKRSPQIDLNRVYKIMIGSDHDDMRNFMKLLAKSSTFAHKAHKHFKNLENEGI